MMVNFRGTLNNHSRAADVSENLTDETVQLHCNWNAVGTTINM